MDFLDFIPSKTVKDYVRESGYKLTSKDATCIVYNSERSLEDKLNAYQAIIDTMPDCKIDNTGKMLHSVLQSYISAKTRLIKQFYNATDNAFYRCNIWSLSSDDNTYKLTYRIEREKYNSLQDCINVLHGIPNETINEFVATKFSKNF